MVTYGVSPAFLQPRVPRGLELDVRDGQAFISLVAFVFEDTRVLGIPWPGYRSFPELNLRFYVRRRNDRGVVFLREFAPRRLVCWIANFLYAEHYVFAPLACAKESGPRSLKVEYQLSWGGRLHRLAVTGHGPPFVPEARTAEHFFKEQRWGFGLDRCGKLTRYEVAHPPWAVYSVKQWELDLDWASVYGKEWGVLQGAKPCSVILAVGSEVAVGGRRPG